MLYKAIITKPVLFFFSRELINELNYVSYNTNLFLFSCLAADRLKYLFQRNLITSEMKHS